MDVVTVVPALEHHAMGEAVASRIFNISIGWR
jgi:hypothetical protein